MVTTETDNQKYQRWLEGKEKAKKMWFAKYQKACRERDHAVRLLRRSQQWNTFAGKAFLIGLIVGLLVSKL
jgi:hypothetical protein